MKHSFQTEIYRYAMYLKYLEGYRNAENKTSMLALHSDITASEEDLDDYDPRLMDLRKRYDRLENPEWLRRYIIGYREKKIGRHIFTTPGRNRFKQVMAYLRDQNILSPVILADHKLSIEESTEYASLNRYDDFDVQSVLYGVRGWFYGFCQTSDGLMQTLLLIHHVKNEGPYRIRKIQCHYIQGQKEDDMKLHLRLKEMDFNSCSVVDGFANLNPTMGRIFLQDDKSADIELDNFSYNSNGRKLVSLDIEENGQKNRLTVPKTPDNIRYVTRLLKNIK